MALALDPRPETVPVISIYIEASATFHLQVATNATEQDVLRLANCSTIERLQTEFKMECGQLSCQVEPPFDHGETAGGYLSRTHQAVIRIYARKEEAKASPCDDPLERGQVKLSGIAAAIAQGRVTNIGPLGVIGSVKSIWKKRRGKSKKKGGAGQEGLNETSTEGFPTIVVSTEGAMNSLSGTVPGSSSGAGLGSVVERLQEEMRMQGKRLMEELAAMKGEAANVSGRINRLEDENRDLKDEIRDLKDENRVLKDGNHDLQDKIRVLNDRYSQVKKRLSKIEKGQAAITARCILDGVCSKLEKKLQLQWERGISNVDRRRLIRERLDSGVDTSSWPEELADLASPIHRDRIYSFAGRPKLRRLGDRAAHTTSFDVDNVSTLLGMLQDGSDRDDREFVRLAVKLDRPDWVLREEVEESN